MFIACINLTRIGTEQKITDVKAMRQSNEVMQHELENLERENERLGIETAKLQGSIDR